MPCPWPWWFLRCFNPRSPRGGATGAVRRLSSRHGMFQSTLPTRGSDRVSFAQTVAQSSFNPRSPRGGATPRSPLYRVCGLCFNPRSPRGGATTRLCIVPSAHLGFNPRSPRGGATGEDCSGSPCQTSFNPRSPRGGATPVARCIGYADYVSIHAPHEGERLCVCLYATAFNAFQSTLPTRGSDKCGAEVKGNYCPFQSTLPTRGSDDVLAISYT